MNFGPDIFVGISKLYLSAGCVFRGIGLGLLVGVGLIKLLSCEVEYCLAANAVRCRIYECFVEFCFVYWTKFACMHAARFVAWSTRVLTDVMLYNVPDGLVVLMNSVCVVQ